MSRTTQEFQGAHSLVCEEIWGGFRAADTGVSVPGIDAWVISRPFADDISGGDIHYVGLCGHGLLSRFVVADVFGHGEAVAAKATRLRDLMSLHMNTPDQTELVRAMNEDFVAPADAGRYATAVFMSYVATNDHLITVNAGHPRPLWYSRSEARWRLLTHEVPASVDELMDLPLGVVTETGYQQFALPLAKDDLVVVYTDSLMEACNAEGMQLGEEGLAKLAESLGPDNPSQFGHALLDAVVKYRQGGPLLDDVTVLTLHHNAADPPAP